MSVQIHFGIDFLSGDKDVLSLVHGEHLSPEKFMAYFQVEKGRCICCFSSTFHFKIVNVPKWHILGWHVLNSLLYTRVF